MSILHTTHLDADHHHLSPSSSSSEMSDCMSEVDLEMGLSSEEKLHSGNKTQGDCRICHLGLESNEQECGAAIELGCSCKGDLGAAHRKCAETWFKIKGNMICEICDATALNVANEQTNDVLSVAAAAPTVQAAPLIHVDNRTFWHSRRVMNILLACMVIAFIISWLFHFKILT